VHGATLTACRQYAARIVGTKGKNLQEITEKANVARINVEDHASDPASVLLHVTGRKVCSLCALRSCVFLLMAYAGEC
jgi:hypothetical protein